MPFDPNFPADDSEMKALEYRALFPRRCHSELVEESLPGDIRWSWLGKANADKNKNHQLGLCHLPVTLSHY